MQNNSKLSTDNSKFTSILVTGGAGFIGSNFVPYFLEKYPNYRIINLDLLTYAGDLDNLKEVDDILNSQFLTHNSQLKNDRYHFIKGDICNRELIEFIFDEYNIQGVIHFAAESHVDNSIKNPGVFVETNVNGTFTLLDVAYKYWMDGPFKYKERYLSGMMNDELRVKNEEIINNDPTDNSQFSILNSQLGETVPRFHHISTDEVYGTLSDDPDDLFTEKTPYAPNSPYSASKASSDMIVRSYVETYGMNCVITNCSNNYGPKQHDEKLIPTIIRNALAGNPIPIYGDGKNIRDWLYVLDHCKGIDLVYHAGKKGETYNIGGRNERTNLQIVDRICALLDEMVPRHSREGGNPDPEQPTRHPEQPTRHPELDSGSPSYKELITFVEDRAGHDRRYAIDATKLENELGWKADENFDTGIVKTIEWYLEKYSK